MYIHIVYLNMNFEWDGRKNQNNILKYGISFKEAIRIFDNIRLTQIDERYNYREIREISIGEISSFVVIIVVYTKRNNKIRIISARKANTKERKKFYEYVQKKNEGDKKY